MSNPAERCRLVNPQQMEAAANRQVTGLILRASYATDHLSITNGQDSGNTRNAELLEGLPRVIGIDG